MRVLGPVFLAAGAALAVLAGPGGLSAPSVPRRGIPDPKVRRTVKTFVAEAEDPAPAPLEDPTREGLPIDLEIEPSLLEAMLPRTNREWFKNRRVFARVRFGGGPARPASLHLRGGSTLRRGRLNFTVSLFRQERFRDDLQIKRFYLLGLHFDPHEIEKYFAQTIVRELGVFPLHFQYAKVSVNGRPEGMYLLVEPAKEGTRRAFPDAVALYRRRYRNCYDTEWERSVPRAGASLSALRGLIYEPPERGALAAVAARLDLDGYFAFLAVNSVLLNLDSGDELFLVDTRAAAGTPEPLRVVGWDYDDLFSNAQKSGSADDPLMHSSIDPLDHVIHNDPELRAAYRESLRRLLKERLTPEYLVRTLEETAALRGGLDDGLPAAAQEKARAERANAVRIHAAALRERHAELLRH